MWKLGSESQMVRWYSLAVPIGRRKALHDMIHPKLRQVSERKEAYLPQSMSLFML